MTVGLQGATSGNSVRGPSCRAELFAFAILRCECRPDGIKNLRSRAALQGSARVDAGMQNEYEIVVVGGGPAGLSGALVLGRCGRRVLVVDAGHPRNSRSSAVRGYLTRDSCPPHEFLAAGRSELARYPTVEWLDGNVAQARAEGRGYAVLLNTGRWVTAKKLLLCTGLVDLLPSIQGLEERWGTSVFPCPFCDAWEFRGQPIALLGCDSLPCEFAFELLTWTRQLTLLTDGRPPPSPEWQERLARARIGVEATRIARLEGPDRQLERITFIDGRTVDCRALFLVTRQRQASALAEQLGCTPLTPDQTVPTSPLQHSRVRGVFVAGNAAEGLQVAILAAAEGFKAAYAINDELVNDEFSSSSATATCSESRH